LFFVLRADVIHHHDGGDGGGVILMEDDRQSVRELILLEFNVDLPSRREGEKWDRQEYAEELLHERGPQVERIKEL
jgi:hypothetical protein